MILSRALLAACVLGALAIATSSAATRQTQSTLIRGGQLVDGTGGAPRIADVRLSGDMIAEIGSGLAPRAGELVPDASRLTVAPGFIDPHSHADRGLDDHPNAATQIRQGITTAIVGQDGESTVPIAEFYERIEHLKPGINFATSVGHGTIRSIVLGGDFRRAATPAELEVMTAIAERAMRDGALGLSSGLEYDPGFFSTLEELVALAAVAATWRLLLEPRARRGKAGVRRVPRSNRGRTPDAVAGADFAHQARREARVGADGRGVRYSRRRTSERRPRDGGLVPVPVPVLAIQHLRAESGCS
jgi:hypothetical protein